MNGRVYDPTLGRFLSADPFIQFPASTQGLNRYSYVFNNPLSFTDPSGYFLKWLARTVKKLLKNPVVRTVVGVAFAVYGAPHLASAMLGTSTGVAFAVAKGAIGGFGAGLIASGGDLKAAFIGGLTGAAFGYIGGSSTFGGEFSGQRLLAHGVVGGMSSRLQGGKFATGFFSAGVAKLMTPAIETVADGNLMLGAVASAVVGGTATAVGGGKFANGATTGAFGYLFNQHANDEAMRVRKEPVWPTDYREITSPYSLSRVDPTTGKQSLPHTAIDIRNPHGGRVYSILDGVVVSVDYSDNPGNYVKIVHGNGLETSYSHTESVVNFGDLVTHGQIIGYSNSSGRISGPHLHFVTRRSGARVNPCTILSCP